MKICRICKEAKPLKEFGVYRGGKKRVTCKFCRKKKRKISKKKDPEKWLEYRLKHVYGISLKEYHGILLRQDGKCAICKIPEKELSKPLLIDHDHVTGCVRGLLCYSCNTAIGLFKDNNDLLKQAQKYLTSPRNI